MSGTIAGCKMQTRLWPAPRKGARHEPERTNRDCDRCRLRPWRSHCKGARRKWRQSGYADLDFDRAAQVAGEIGGMATRCDVASAESGEAAMAQIAERLGPPRILVNCAGIVLGMKTVGRDGPHPLERFAKVVEVNLIGTFNMIRLFAHRVAELQALEGGERG